MNNFEAIIFDMDGLLLDSEEIALVAFNETLDYFGLESQTELFFKLIGTNALSCRKILREELRGKTDSDKFGKLWDKMYMEKTLEAPIPLKKGVLELLDYINNIGLISAVATSTKTEEAIKKLKSAGILDYFKVVVGGERVKEGKPNPEIYLLAAKELSVNPKNCLGLEDSENGVKSAFSAGLTVIQIPDLVQPSDELKKLGHIILESLDDVVNYQFLRRKTT